MKRSAKSREDAPYIAPRGRFWIAGFLLIIGLRHLASILARLKRKLFGIRYAPGPNTMPRSIPRIIYIYWDKGEAAAPMMVRECIASWRRCNPGWDVHVLSASDVPEFVELSDEMVRSLPVQSFADLLRLRLLRKTGGVWADATLFCIAPLDHWLPVLAQRGFFAFSWTEADRWRIWPDVRRRMTNWFLASEAEGTVIGTWEAHASGYFQNRTSPHTYYWPHFMIDWLYLRHRTFRQALDAAPQLGAFAPHLVHDCVTRNGDDDAVQALLRAGVAPVQKLRWNYDEATVGRALAMLRGSESL